MSNSEWGAIPRQLAEDVSLTLKQKFNVQTGFKPSEWNNNIKALTPLPEKTVSGSIVTFSDGADDAPLKSCVITLSDSLVGYTSVTIDHTDGQTPPVFSQQYTVDIGRTIYGGELDVINGTGTDENGNDFTFDPISIYSISGNNTLWSDGDLEVIYRSNEIVTPIERKDVNYYDCFGNLLFSYTSSEFLAMSANPEGENITDYKTPLTFDSWNYTFADAKTYVTNYGKLEIGGLYYPTDEKTHIFLDIKNSEYSDITMNIGGDSLIVDWGDGTVETISATTLSHNYNASGVFEITIAGRVVFSGVMFPDYIRGNYLTELFLYDTGSTLYSDEFSYHSSLRVITLSNNFDTIPASAFRYCASLKALNIPTSITKIVNYAFQYSSIEIITIPNSVTDIGTYSFEYTRIKTLTLPVISRINNHLCTYCTNLETVVFSNGSGTSVGSNLFQYCTSLQFVKLPNGITSTNTSIFGFCFSLKSISLPDGVTNIGQTGLESCNSLRSLKLPKALTTIGSQAFRNCKNLLYLDFSECVEIPTINANALTSTDSLVAIIVPDNLYDTWKTSGNWVNFVGMIVKASEYEKPF